MQALTQLQSNEEPVINTWTICEISASISNICDTLEKEFKLKQVITGT